MVLGLNQTYFDAELMYFTMVNRKQFLYGWWLTYPSEKYEFASWDYSQYIDKKQTCSKAPTRLLMDP
jgi:hypothetical protein